jgi:hypothetical protein
MAPPTTRAVPRRSLNRPEKLEAVKAPLESLRSSLTRRLNARAGRMLA